MCLPYVNVQASFVLESLMAFCTSMSFQKVIFLVHVILTLAAEHLRAEVARDLQHDKESRHPEKIQVILQRQK
jgi:hypothetical protein